jgi:hypothetical protein
MDHNLEFIKSLDAWTPVRVTWRDAHAPHSGWHEVDEYQPETAEATTLGRVWHDCQKHYLTLAGTIFESEDGNIKTVGDINHIPIAWIVKIEVL